MCELLGRGERPTALFCESGVIGVGAYNALRDAGVVCPEEMELLAFGGDVETAALFAPGENPLSMVSEPLDEVGAAGAELLDWRLRQPGASRQQAMVKTRLIQGRTTRPDASGNNKSQNQ